MKFMKNVLAFTVLLSLLFVVTVSCAEDPIPSDRVEYWQTVAEKIYGPNHGMKVWADDKDAEYTYVQGACSTERIQLTDETFEEARKNVHNPNSFGFVQICPTQSEQFFRSNCGVPKKETVVKVVEVPTETEKVEPAGFTLFGYYHVDQIINEITLDKAVADSCSTDIYMVTRDLGGKIHEVYCLEPPEKNWPTEQHGKNWRKSGAVKFVKGIDKELEEEYNDYDWQNFTVAAVKANQVKQGKVEITGLSVYGFWGEKPETFLDGAIKNPCQNMASCNYRRDVFFAWRTWQPFRLFWYENGKGFPTLPGETSAKRGNSWGGSVFIWAGENSWPFEGWQRWTRPMKPTHRMQ